jgi:formamidopyrimidine-DNA glycosylase
MPELPEVENYRQLLLPLQSDIHTIQVERLSLDKKPPRKFLSDEDIESINQQKYQVSNVVRKGKLLCLVLKNAKKEETKYLFVHMGMTGRISTPEHVPSLESLATTDYPPPHCYLKFSCCGSSSEACFSDPRKFGSIQLSDSFKDMDDLAPDAWTDLEEHRSSILNKFVNKSMGIKALLLDQKRAVSGVGNWVADEVLYQIEMHPDQNHLDVVQATTLLDTLHDILQTAVECLKKRQEFPIEWLFHYRWSKKKSSTPKDSKGRTIAFVTSGGRTSAIVQSIQKKKASNNKTSKATKKRALDETTTIIKSDSSDDKQRKKATNKKQTSKAEKVQPEKQTSSEASKSKHKSASKPPTKHETKRRSVRVASSGR